ncbi:Pkinase-domain-containing protein [Auricularia subglabra TFB-10046 SS5]|uniref:non-specific serine/threonine protein kinase n=1 Tax=Auricularia subglabra (strain TFB-10046 / SS5) TaxID=717982 RepID=J0WVC3_AURST|nr:Pkinase-domain-containing protein [Auricularia subglabra TFB-10046 SS5]
MSGQAVPVTQLYKRLEVVGKGAYGSVHRGVHIATGQVVAIKIINLDTADDDVEDIQHEVALLAQLRGGDQNNITRYYGCWLDGPRVWIVMDFASGGSVRTLMKALPSGIVEERYVVVIVREVLVALAYLHKANVIHRDIKAANILITSSGRVLLCDFGVAALLATTQSKRTTFVGTPYWMAPEVITTGSLYDTKADIWSLGITVYEMAMGAPPHADQVGMKALVIIPKAKPPRLPEERGTKEMREFVASTLRELPSDRLTAEELAKTKWIKSSSKVSVGVLRDLLHRYSRWQEGGGVRESIVGDLEWEMEEEA